jgi:hypothetical protein
MNLWDFLTSDRFLTALAGLAGAAAMAATDWSTPLRFFRHIFVGTAAAAFASPVFAPAIGKIFSWMAVNDPAQGQVTGFLTGAFGIFVFEYALAFWRAKTSQIDKEDDK